MSQLIEPRSSDLPPVPKILLSHFQITPLIKARRRGESEGECSVDLFKSPPVSVTWDETGIVFPGGERLTWKDAEEISETDNACFALERGEDEPAGGEGIRKIGAFSEETRRYVSLYPTRSAPTMLIAGFPMHRIKNTDPMKDTAAKIKAAAPLGTVLDTSMGLGYTAIAAARTAGDVLTLEIDPTVMRTAAQNPWSADLFTNPKIERRIVDSRDAIPEFEDGQFTTIIHDPPVINLAGDLYSGDFYAELLRILAKRGRLFHYIGDLASVSGERTSRGVIRRLTEVGFVRVAKRPDAFGVVAFKA